MSPSDAADLKKSKLDPTATPPGFEPVVRGRRQALVQAQRLEAVERLGFLDGEPRIDPIGTVEGRSQYGVYPLDSGFSVIWKQCRRGGWAEPFLKDKHWGLGRFLAELELSVESRRAGVCVDEIVALAWERSAVGSYRVELLTLRLEGACDLAECLAAPSASIFRNALIAAASELRRFHGHGFFHGDLNLKNILWQALPSKAADSSSPDRPSFPGHGASDAERFGRATLIDLDPGPRRRPGTRRSESAVGNLLRLWRSYLKGEARGRFRLSRSDLWRFLDVYFRGDRLSVRRFWQLAQQRRRLYRWRHRVRPSGAPSIDPPLDPPLDPPDAQRGPDPQ